MKNRGFKKIPRRLKENIRRGLVKEDRKPPSPKWQKATYVKK